MLAFLLSYSFLTTPPLLSSPSLYGWVHSSPVDVLRLLSRSRLWLFALILQTLLFSVVESAPLGPSCAWHATLQMCVTEALCKTQVFACEHKMQLRFFLIWLKQNWWVKRIHGCNYMILLFCFLCVCCFVCWSLLFVVVLPPSFTYSWILNLWSLLVRVDTVAAYQIPQCKPQRLCILLCQPKQHLLLNQPPTLPIPPHSVSLSFHPSLHVHSSGNTRTRRNTTHATLSTTGPASSPSSSL